MKYTYTGYDKEGAQISGVIEGATQDDALDRLRRKGHFVTEIREGETANQPMSPARRSRKKVGPKLVAHFARELSVLISTGTPIADAVISLEMQAPVGPWRDVLAVVRRGLEEGDSFSESLERRPDAFDAVFVSLVAAGESSGQLDAMLHRLAMLTRRQAQLRSGVMGAMAYPVLLTCVCFAVLGLMLGVVLPRFSGLFETLDTPLPATTKMLVAISNTLIGSWYLVFPPVFVVIGALVWWLRSEGGTRAFQSFVLRLPKVGEIVRSFGTARIARLMGTLLGAKVPMIEAIALTRRSTSNHRFVALLDRAERMVTKGEPISTALMDKHVFLPSAAQAIRNAEQSGRLSEVMVHVADYLDEENQATVKSLSSLLEPLIMIVLGGLVAFVAVSMFLPLFDLTASAGGAR